MKVFINENLYVSKKKSNQQIAIALICGALLVVLAGMFV